MEVYPGDIVWYKSGWGDGPTSQITMEVIRKQLCRVVVAVGDDLKVTWLSYPPGALSTRLDPLESAHHTTSLKDAILAIAEAERNKARVSIGIAGELETIAMEMQEDQ